MRLKVGNRSRISNLISGYQISKFQKFYQSTKKRVNYYKRSKIYCHLDLFNRKHVRTVR